MAPPSSRTRHEAKANRVDAHVGRCLRQQRLVMGLSQVAVAQAAGVTLRQIQKYESGIDRVSAASLYRIGRLSNVPVSYFFAGLPLGHAGALSTEADHDSAETPLEDGILARRETLDLVRAYYRITSGEQRRKLSAVIRGLADAST
jgi:transcriptional regulator with XRE-family HTH domain